MYQSYLNYDELVKKDDKLIECETLRSFVRCLVTNGYEILGAKDKRIRVNVYTLINEPGHYYLYKLKVLDTYVNLEPEFRRFLIWRKGYMNNQSFNDHNTDTPKHEENTFKKREKLAEKFIEQVKLGNVSFRRKGTNDDWNKLSLYSMVSNTMCDFEFKVEIVNTFKFDNISNGDDVL